jgi:myo-inositol-1-phosphate synthase
MGGLVGGNDLSTGQSRLKAVLADFLTSAGFRIRSVTSYNHLGQNDGLNLDESAQFKSKERSKSGMLDRIIATNPAVAYDAPPPHTVVIKYVKPAGDNKKALDEYVSQVFLDSEMTMNIATVCPDSMLAVPIMLDLVLIGDWLSRLRLPSGLAAAGPVAGALAMFFKDEQGDMPPAAFFTSREALLNLIRAVGGQPLYTPLAKL